MTTITATPAKLRNGSWGARIESRTVGGAAKAGDTITVRAKSGKTWQATVTRVLWTGGPDRTVQLVATRGNDRPAPARRSARSRCETCRCHREYARTGFSADLHDGCDYCGCEIA